MTKGFKKFYFVFMIMFCLVLSLTSCKKKCEHEYDNACDSTCNLCEEVRDVGEHEFNSADCINAKTCKFCGVTEGEPLGHSPAEDDGDCTTPIKCKICEEVVINVIEHDFSGNFVHDESGHWKVCQNDNCNVANEKINHTCFIGISIYNHCDRCHIFRTICIFAFIPICNNNMYV